MDGNSRTGPVAGHGTFASSGGRRRWPDGLKARRLAAESHADGTKAGEAARRKASQPIVGEPGKWMAESRPRVPFKPPVGEVLACFANHWESPTLFLDDGRVKQTIMLIVAGVSR